MLCLTTSVYIFMLHQRQHFQSNMEAAQHKLCELKPAIPYNRISFEKLEKKCKRKEKLYSEDLVQHRITIIIIISCRMKTEIQTQSVFSTHVRGRFLSAQAESCSLLQIINSALLTLGQSRSSHRIYSHRAAAVIKQGLKVLDTGTGWKSSLGGKKTVSKSLMQLKKFSFRYHKNPKICYEIRRLILE